MTSNGLRLLLVVALAHGLGCTGPIAAECSVDTDCEPGLLCRRSLCIDPTTDAGRADAPGADVPEELPSDGGESDGGIALDAPTLDAALPTDAGTGTAPAVEGFGAETRGGEGMPVVHVTNTDASGAGSFAQAISEGGRTVVFDVGGVVSLSSNLYIRGLSDITIDGSTAPSPGFTLEGGGFIIEGGSHDVIVRGIRVRGAEDDGIRVYDSHHIVFDHCSSADNGDGSLDITENSHDVTVQWCVLGPAGSGVMLIAYGTRDVSLHHNLYSSQQESGVGERNPFLHNNPSGPAGYLMADIRNNLVWGWGRDDGESYGYGTGVDYGATANVVNNFYQTSGGLGDLAIELNHDDSGAVVFAEGNFSGNGEDLSGVGNRASAFPAAAITTTSACVAARAIVAGAGARPLDAMDAAMIGDVSLTACP